MERRKLHDRRMRVKLPRMYKLIPLVMLTAFANAHTTGPTNVLITPFPDLVGDAEQLHEVLDECAGFDTPEFEPTEECIIQMDEYFASRPIWNYSTVVNYHKDLSIPRRIHTLLSPRVMTYGHTDRTSGDIPVWRDIFDNRFVDRIKVVEQVFADEVCRDLLESESFQPTLTSRCKTRELFKYATYLDTCLTAMWRAEEWIRMDRDSPSPHGSYMEIVLQSLQSNLDQFNWIGDPTYEQLALQFRETMLHVAWMQTQCEFLELPRFDQDLKLIPSGSENRNLGSVRFDLVDIFQSGHDAAMRIAALSGDKWALHRYSPQTSKEEIKYWKAIFSAEPLLVHRYLASYRLTSLLTPEEAHWHAIQVYILAKEQDPEMDLNLEQYTASEFSEGMARRLGEILEKAGLTESEILWNKELLESRLKYPW